MMKEKVKRRKIFGAVLGLLALLCSGCGRNAPGQPAGTPVPEKATASSVQVLHQVRSQTFKDQDGTVLLEAKIVFPEIKDPDNRNGVSLINQYYQTSCDEFFSKTVADALEKAKEDRAFAQKNGYPFFVRTYDRSFSIPYNGNNLLSVLEEQFENFGGAHPDTVRMSQTFDVTTGKKLELTDFLGATQEQALEKVYTAVLAQIKAKQGTDQDVFSEGYTESVRKNYSPQDFWLSDQSMVFCYQLYTIAPYAAGFQQFEIPFSTQGVFARNIPALSASEQEREANSQADQLLARNKTILYQIYGLSMLKLKTPEGKAGTQTIFPVDDERFQTFAQLEEYIRNTYVKSEADALLHNGRYLDQNGKLYGDSSKDTGIGYYVDWDNYTLEVTGITDHEASLKIDTVDDSPAGKVNKTIQAKIMKENGNWLLEKMVQ
jgi:hypothetical protein